MLKRLLIVGALLVLPASAHAQIAWDTPLLVAPRDMPGFGIFVADVYGGDLGLIGTWRAPQWNFGLRAGIAEAHDEDVGVLLGLDFEGGITRSSNEFPLDVDWIVGAGIGVSDGAALSVPLGLIAGHTFRAEGALFTPYVSPRVVLDLLFGGDGPEDDTDADLDLAVDLGLDLRLSQDFMIRFGGTLGDREGVAIGVVF
ncbi:MAG TPA: hypothetical protein VFU06_10865 [Longimicrobiales bacterium]|nr:hypothetical protein [Longimicrobiales bacterium]